MKLPGNSFKINPTHKKYFNIFTYYLYGHDSNEICVNEI